MSANPSKKSCFVIGPIGAKGSRERTCADWLLTGIIRSVLEGEPFDYVVARADEFTEPGLITDQVITSTLDADLVIADLTGYNPNAFYELAIRHMVEKPVIHMLQEGAPPPFDVKDYRVIFYKIEHPDDLKEASEELRKQITAVEARGYTVSNPITRARGHQKLTQSSDPKDKVIAALVARVEAHDAAFATVQTEIARLGTAQTVMIRPTSEGILSPFILSPTVLGDSNLRGIGGLLASGLNTSPDSGKRARDESTTAKDVNPASSAGPTKK